MMDHLHRNTDHPPATVAVRVQDTRAPLAFLLLAGAAALLATALPGYASTFKPPQSCTLEVTVQNRGCSVSQYYRCEADPEGDQRSAIFTREGMTHLSHIDAETRWVESMNPQTGLQDMLVEEAEDHASFSTLLETGEDDFDFWTESSTGERLHHVGRDELTGTTVTIDGVNLEETRFELITYDAAGEELIRRTGQQFISRTMGRFYGGVETQSDWTGTRQNSNDSPVLFSFPGEEGFGETEPQFDCDQLMTQLLQKRAQL